MLELINAIVFWLCIGAIIITGLYEFRHGFKVYDPVGIICSFLTLSVGILGVVALHVVVLLKTQEDYISATVLSIGLVIMTYLFNHVGLSTLYADNQKEIKRNSMRKSIKF